jgi:hypothetical protein
VIEGARTRLDQARARLPAPPNCRPGHCLDLRAGAAAAAEVAQDATWQQNLGVMMEKAKPHGWIDEQKKAIKAHIEWVASA